MPRGKSVRQKRKSGRQQKTTRKRRTRSKRTTGGNAAIAPSSSPKKVTPPISRERKISLFQAKPGVLSDYNDKKNLRKNISYLSKEIQKIQMVSPSKRTPRQLQKLKLLELERQGDRDQLQKYLDNSL